MLYKVKHDEGTLIHFSCDVKIILSFYLCKHKRYSVAF